eukprot:66319_1
MLVRSPLSTSISFEVATHFTNQNNGFIITFAGMGSSSTKTFSMSWLSDFGNEKEHFFTQNYLGDETLQITNVINAKNASEDKLVLKALANIGEIISSGYVNMDTTMHALVSHIICNQISFISLNDYTKKMCDIFFENQTYICISYITWKRKFAFILQWISHADYAWIDICKLCVLFPCIEHIKIQQIKLP